MLSFATVGDSREEAGATFLTPQDAIWLQNTKVWSRIMRGVQALRPQLLFFNGDMIMGYKDAAVAANHEDMNRQYAFWRGMVTQLLETGTYVVPVPGNHETQDKAAGKKSKLANEALWRDNMADLVLDVPRFTALVGTAPRFDVANNPSAAATAPDDHVTTDQKQLSYSFDVGTAHFAVVNTAPRLRRPRARSVARRRSRGSEGGRREAVLRLWPQARLLVFLPARVRGAHDEDERARLRRRPLRPRRILVADRRVRATYFFGHEHIYDVAQPTGHAWQVLVGSGGSPSRAMRSRPSIARTPMPS